MFRWLSGLFTENKGLVPADKHSGPSPQDFSGRNDNHPRLLRTTEAQVEPASPDALKGQGDTVEDSHQQKISTLLRDLPNVTPTIMTPHASSAGDTSHAVPLQPANAHPPLRSEMAAVDATPVSEAAAVSQEAVASKAATAPEATIAAEKSPLEAPIQASPITAAPLNQQVVKEVSPPRETLTPEDVQLKAWNIWKDEGYPEGKSLEHWLQAERDLMH